MEVIILNKMQLIKKELDSLYNDTTDLIKNNNNSVNEEKIKTSKNAYNGLIDEYNNLIDDFEKHVRDEAVPDHYTCITGAVAGVPKFALGLIQPVDNKGKSVNIPNKMSKWQY